MENSITLAVMAKPIYGCGRPIGCRLGHSVVFAAFAVSIISRESCLFSHFTKQENRKWTRTRSSGYEVNNHWKEQYKGGMFDNRAIEETLPCQGLSIAEQKE